jgi:hypothetical protein
LPPSLQADANQAWDLRTGIQRIPMPPHPKQFENPAPSASRIVDRCLVSPRHLGPCHSPSKTPVLVSPLVTCFLFAAGLFLIYIVGRLAIVPVLASFAITYVINPVSEALQRRTFHEFGLRLPQDERDALVPFLKSL